jgi:hypothetical protein
MTLLAMFFFHFRFFSTFLLSFIRLSPALDFDRRQGARW